MSERLEVLISGEVSGQMFNLCVWDPSNGTSLKTYKGNSTKSKTLAFVGNSFIVSGQPHKPLLNVWHLHKHEQKPLKYVTPGVLQSLTVSPCGHFMVGTVEERIYLWQTASGKLLKIITNGHFQKINLTKFTSDGSHFLTAGEDGNVLMWPLDNASQPRHAWSQHSLGVTDFHIGFGGLDARVFTASKDHTANIYLASAGSFLLSVEFPAPLMSITADSAEENLFVGTNSGQIYTAGLKNPPRDLKMSIEQDAGSVFKGHTQAVTSLSVSLDGLTLASGGCDCEVRLWHIKSRQCVRVVPHKGAVTTLHFMIPKAGMLRPEDYRQDVSFSLLEKTAVESNILASDIYAVDVFSPTDSDGYYKEPTARELLQRQPKVAVAALPLPQDEDGTDVGGSSEEIQRLKQINHKLYEAAVQSVLSMQ